MKCPNCGSENCQYVAKTETHGKSFSVSNASNQRNLEGMKHFQMHSLRV